MLQPARIPIIPGKKTPSTFQNDSDPLECVLLASCSSLNPGTIGSSLDRKVPTMKVTMALHLPAGYDQWTRQLRSLLRAFPCRHPLLRSLP